MKKAITTQLQQNTSHNGRTRDKSLNMSLRKSQMKYKHRHLNQKGRNHTNKTYHQPKNYYYMTKINTKNLKNYK